MPENTLAGFSGIPWRSLLLAADYSALRIGDGVSQSGAVLNARYYERNARIFGRLMQIARPGDRVLVVYGFGHGYWLSQFAASVPGYANVEVGRYLARAKAEAGK